MSELLKYSFSESPSVDATWIQATESGRIERINQVLMASDVYALSIKVAEAKENGHVILELTQPLGPEKRGTFLLDLEQHLKDSIDQGISVWLAALGDKNSLRNLRGIKVKSA